MGSKLLFAYFIFFYIISFYLFQINTSILIINNLQILKYKYNFTIFLPKKNNNNYTFLFIHICCEN